MSRCIIWVVEKKWLKCKNQFQVFLGKDFEDIKMVENEQAFFEAMLDYEKFIKSTKVQVCSTEVVLTVVNNKLMHSTYLYKKAVLIGQKKNCNVPLNQLAFIHKQCSNIIEISNAVNEIFLQIKSQQKQAQKNASILNSSSSSLSPLHRSMSVMKAFKQMEELQMKKEKEMSRILMEIKNQDGQIQILVTSLSYQFASSEQRDSFKEIHKNQIQPEESGSSQQQSSVLSESLELPPKPVQTLQQQQQSLQEQQSTQSEQQQQEDEQNYILEQEAVEQQQQGSEKQSIESEQNKHQFYQQKQSDQINDPVQKVAHQQHIPQDIQQTQKQMYKQKQQPVIIVPNTHFQIGVNKDQLKLTSDQKLIQQILEPQPNIKIEPSVQKQEDKDIDQHGNHSNHQKQQGEQERQQKEEDEEHKQEEEEEEDNITKAKELKTKQVENEVESQQQLRPEQPPKPIKQQSKNYIKQKSKSKSKNKQVQHYANISNPPPIQAEIKKTQQLEQEHINDSIYQIRAQLPNRWQYTPKTNQKRERLKRNLRLLQMKCKASSTPYHYSSITNKAKNINLVNSYIAEAQRINQRRRQKYLMLAEEHFNKMEVIWFDLNSNTTIYESISNILKNYRVRVRQVPEVNFETLEQIRQNQNTEYIIIFTNSNFERVCINSIFPFTNCKHYFMYCGNSEYAKKNIQNYSFEQKIFYTTSGCQLEEKITDYVKLRYKKMI